MSRKELGDSKTPGVRRLRLLPEAKILEMPSVWLVRPRLVHTAAALHAGLSQPPHATRSHTLYMHVSLIDAFGSTSCHRPRHCISLYAPTLVDTTP